MKIEIYGTGCQKCRDLYDTCCHRRLLQCGITAEIVKVEDIQKITDAGVFFTPAIAIDGRG